VFPTGSDLDFYIPQDDIFQIMKRLDVMFMFCCKLGALLYICVAQILEIRKAINTLGHESSRELIR
jgi:hypothetical protein